MLKTVFCIICLSSKVKRYKAVENNVIPTVFKSMFGSPSRSRRTECAQEARETGRACPCQRWPVRADADLRVSARIRACPHETCRIIVQICIIKYFNSCLAHLPIDIFHIKDARSGDLNLLLLYKLQSTLSLLTPRLADLKPP